MAKKNNRTCVICNCCYEYCPTCGADVSKPTWYHVFDGENCHDIYETCVAYRDNVISQKEAFERMSALDISNVKNFAPATQKQIEEIMSYKEEADKAKEMPKMVYKNIKAK